MNAFASILAVALAGGGGAYMIYALATRGLKGALLGHKIVATHKSAIQYRQQGAMHTIRLHRLGTGDLYGLEVGRWTGILGETSAIVIPHGDLAQLSKQISLFLKERGDSDGPAPEAGYHLPAQVSGRESKRP